MNLPFEPYPEQIEAARACYRHGSGIVVAPTGLGKSAIVALIINELRVKTLVVVPSLELKKQLTASLKMAFRGRLVGQYGSIIAVENVDALDPTLISPYDCVIVDEFHHSAASTYRKLNLKSWGSVYHRIGLTATPFRSDDTERLLLESVLSQVIYRVTYEQAVSKGRIVPLEAYYIDLPKQKMKGDPRIWSAVYSELVTNNETRHAIIVRLIESLKGTPILCLVKEIQHGATLSQMTQVPFANGQEGDTRIKILEFNLGQSKALIGTTGVIGEGVDTKPAEYIILAGSGKAKTQFMQACGRGFRVFPGKESCKVILFRDRSHKFLERHFKECVKHLKDEYGVVPVKLEV